MERELSKKEFDVLYSISRCVESDIINYKNDLHFNNREDFFIQNKGKSEIDFLLKELENLNIEEERLKKTGKAITKDFEKYVPEKNIDDELNYWYNLENANRQNIDFIKQKIATEKLLSNDKIKPVNSKRPEDREWFNVGLKFADGTIKYKTLNRPTFKDITIEAELPVTLRPYVSDTYQSTGKKNIFASKKKMTAIYNHCIENKIQLSEWFLSKYKQIIDKD